VGPRPRWLNETKKLFSLAATARALLVVVPFSRMLATTARAALFGAFLSLLLTFLLGFFHELNCLPTILILAGFL
jgi:hypothetical protein